ncbi:MAG: hypothetical protein ACSHX4_08580 [Opitutaceae bacterium]
MQPSILRSHSRYGFNGFIPWSAFLLYAIVQVIAATVAGYLFRSMKITNPEELPTT